MFLNVLEGFNRFCSPKGGLNILVKWRIYGVVDLIVKINRFKSREVVIFGEEALLNLKPCHIPVLSGRLFWNIFNIFEDLSEDDLKPCLISPLVIFNFLNNTVQSLQKLVLRQLPIFRSLWHH